MIGRCKLCGREHVDPNSRYTWHHVEAYERPGKAGGSDITLRERTGQGFAHDDCVRRKKDGIPPDQTTLI